MHLDWIEKLDRIWKPSPQVAISSQPSSRSRLLLAQNKASVGTAPKATDDTDAASDSTIPMSSKFSASLSTSTAATAIPASGASSDSSPFGAASLSSTTAPLPLGSSLTSTSSSSAADASSFHKLFPSEFEDPPRISGVSLEFLASCFTSVLCTGNQLQDRGLPADHDGSNSGTLVPPIGDLLREWIVAGLPLLSSTEAH
ncbi:hypothetical protein NE237_002239 [Protea cynaroides]|uniref:Uncharacterized protein n=1 Tax=Protea cynaroides TaxID=273540 RepID=A0A9Q0KUN8_9MAGN|nr:hypothetical protein NE237_002239 [Protea cynaroides]